MRIFWIGKLHGLRSAEIDCDGPCQHCRDHRLGPDAANVLYARSRLSNGRLRQNGAPDYESGGQEFESLRARQLNQELLAFLRSPICPENAFGQTMGR
jgi:hypothetical protein